ncbi:sensor histidine kinase [Microbacterium sp. SSM24]|uniref:sensor histidine kinase n=1 Tax=Microbacterium sp. SSM24 TaxID=2991714 RepID=UPI002227CEE9|nr:sensor histidine kinase [Microbacterium sp. SSM24]MCW3492040.1 sensor histidine kinase [Microbacterium sp. SSM24]
MPHTALTPVFVGLRTGLHVLFAALAVLVIVRAVISPTENSVAAIVLTLGMIATYGVGAIKARTTGQNAHAVRLLWLAALTLEWVVLLWLTPEAAYLVFPLFFLYLHLLGPWWGAAAIVLATVTAICALGIHNGWSLAGVVGPLIGAGVALLIGLGYQALAREAEQRETLMRELLATRGQLAATEHESGVLAERARLAREIHDTVAQGLSSIQMLLHAAEKADPDRPGAEHIRLARETAANNLADARRFIRELTPPDLDDRGLGGALRRLANTRWAAQGLQVNVRVSDKLDLPMHVQTALLRIAQGAIANVIQHAHATTATITLAADHERLQFTIADDGEGFDPHLATVESRGHSDSFGLQAIRERAEQLGGSLTIDTYPGGGTQLTIELTLEQPT